MGSLLVILLVAVSLSMDAFSLAIIYGTYGLSRKNEIILSMVVGLFHFFMPLFGIGVGNILTKYFVFSVDFVVGIIFLFIGVSMVISCFRDEEIKVLVSGVGFLLFGFSVSIDSLTTGIGLSLISHYYYFLSSVFMVVSGFFTFIGLKFGKFLNKRFGRYANGMGGIIMIFLAFYYIFIG